MSTMQVPVATIRAQDHLRNSFDGSVNYLKTFLATSDVAENRNVGSATTANNRDQNSNSDKKKGKASGAKKKKTSDTKALDRYYKPAEWFALDEETRKKVLEARKKRRKISKVTSSDGKQDEDSDV